MNEHTARAYRGGELHFQEQFPDDRKDLLFTDLAAFNRAPAEQLVTHNTVLLHHGPGLQAPNAAAPYTRCAGSETFVAPDREGHHAV